MGFVMIMRWLLRDESGLGRSWGVAAAFLAFSKAAWIRVTYFSTALPLTAEFIIVVADY